MNSDSDHSALTSSLTDMMTSLMVIFVLLLVNYLGSRQDEVKAVILENAQRTEQIQAARSKTDEMQEQLAVKLRQGLVDGIKVEKLDNYNLVVIVPEDKLQFEIGKNVLNEAAIAFLSRFIPIFLGVYLQFESDVSLVNVEGHADHKLRKDAANEYYNWDLSQERASAVMKFIFNLKKGSAETESFKRMALFGGRGPIECNYPAEAEENLRKNCRTVKFKVRMRSSEEAGNLIKEIQVR